MSRFREDLHYIKFGMGPHYPQPQVKKENIFDLIYRSDFNAVEAQFIRGFQIFTTEMKKGRHCFIMLYFITK